jgi:hypothetical protein
MALESVALLAMELFNVSAAFGYNHYFNIGPKSGYNKKCRDVASGIACIPAAYS